MEVALATGATAMSARQTQQPAPPPNPELERIRQTSAETIANLTGSGQYHWMAGNFLKYGASEATFGSKNAGDIPVDAHQLIALCAPRPTFISYGVAEKGDAKWLDQQGCFMATVAAGPAFRLLGAKDLGRSDDYMKEKKSQLPTPNSQ